MAEKDSRTPGQPSDFSRPKQAIGDHDDVDFAPTDLTDGRHEDEWASRYTGLKSRLQIWIEAAYLAILLYGSAFFILLVWLETPQDWLDVSQARYSTFSVYAYAWLAGLLGGTLFSIKWLYHSVAKGYWNADRLAWRIFTPHLSSAFSFGLIAIVTSGIFEILNQTLIRTPPAVVGVGFLLGYFSDFTVARLYRLARELLGEPSEGHNPPDS